MLFCTHTPLCSLCAVSLSLARHLRCPLCKELAIAFMFAKTNLTWCYCFFALNYDHVLQALVDNVAQKAELDEATADAIEHAVLHKAMSNDILAERASTKSQYDKV
jgi:hypothetical protein